MTKRKIQIIVGLMCIALIGLIGLQWYWIREAIAIRNEQFNHKVSESVQEVVHRLEKQEMMYLLQQRIEREQQKSKLERITQLRNAPVRKAKPAAVQEASRETAARTPHNIEVFIGPNGEEIHYRIATEGVPTDVLSPNFRVMVDHQQKIMEEFFQAQQFGMAGIDEFMRRRMEEEKGLGKVFNQMNGQKDNTKKQSAATGNIQQPSYLKARKENQDKAALANAKNLPLTARGGADKAEILREVMQDLLYTKRPIQERVNRFLLDTLLKKEFEENGITLPYEFAVQGNNPGNLLFSTANLQPTDWQQKSYKASLFPNETTQGQNSLFVYFPDQQRHIMSGMGVMFGGSGVLILVVMICFYLAVTTILRQKKLSDIKNDFINNMTHEFKTPISTIALAAEMAQENSAGGTASLNLPRLSRYLGIIREENRRLGTHVEKVLQMALLDKGEVKLKKTLVNMTDLTTNALNSLSVQIENQNGIVDLEFEAENEQVLGDEVHLANVLNNLIDNAIKYSPEQLHLTIRTSNTNNGLELAITDKGIGMKREQLHRIFDTFYRVPTGNVHDVKGFGLGLSYVKTMVEAHGGTVTADSKPGEGSTFIIWLPIAAEA
jgi:two-component system phosphate regulon sensor histidine kinase PhoR